LKGLDGNGNCKRDRNLTLTTGQCGAFVLPKINVEHLIVQITINGFC